MSKEKKTNTVWIVKMGILLAIMLLFTFTSIGYIKVGVIEITMMVLPVAVGGIVLGPAAGAILGTFFGITSFIQCFGMSAFGVLMLSLNPVGAAVTCIVPRFLCGFIPAVVFNVFRKKNKKNIGTILLAGVLTAILNTIFFMLSIIIFFWHNDSFMSTMVDWGIAMDSIWLFFIAFVGLNGVIEAAFNAVAATAVSKVLFKLEKRD